jgi:hypothetical protein
MITMHKYLYLSVLILIGQLATAKSQPNQNAGKQDIV